MRASPTRNRSPVFLASLIAGPPAESFFFDAALSFYAVEETGLSQGLTGQSSDAWVVLLQQKQALLPLSDAQLVEMSQVEEELYDFFRAVMEGGSVVRWLVAEYGWDVVWELRAGGDPETVTGALLFQVEEKWLAAIAAQGLQPKTCLLAVPGNPVFRGLCRRLDEADG